LPHASKGFHRPIHSEPAFCLFSFFFLTCLTTGRREEAICSTRLVDQP
jgi:hypothetical protein